MQLVPTFVSGPKVASPENAERGNKQERMRKMRRITMKAARVNAGLTQTEAANRIGVAPSTLKNWESGVTCPKIPYFMKMCQIYKVPCDSIFFEEKIS